MPVSLMVPVINPKDQVNMIQLSDDSRSGSRSNDSGVAGGYYAPLFPITDLYIGWRT